MALPLAKIRFKLGASLSLSAQGEQTKYAVRVMHGSTEDCGKHAALGFQENRGVALAPLVAFMKDPSAGV